MGSGDEVGLILGRGEIDPIVEEMEEEVAVGIEIEVGETVDRACAKKEGEHRALGLKSTGKIP